LCFYSTIKENLFVNNFTPDVVCIAVHTKTLDEMRADEARILAGEPVSTQSENSVDDVPQEFKDWIKENEERIERAKSKPYFIRNND
jgi:hypothetical protein